MVSETYRADFARGLPWKEGGAQFSADRRHRYRLWRHWGPGGGHYAAFVMLNPSTAGAYADDPTVRRVVGFAKRERLDGLVVVNLFSLVATDPKELHRAAYDAKGDTVTNRWVVRQACSQAALVVAAWGAHAARYPFRVQSAFQELDELEKPVHVFVGTTKSGQPLHPLRLRRDLPLVLHHRRGS